MRPSVSVVIPVYNGTNYLAEAIESVLAQTYTDYEVLVVDDGSTDETWELIQSFGDKVRGLHKPNGGVASALNLGIQKMRGRWFAWLSHDDLWLPRKLEMQVAFLEANPNLKVCYTDFAVMDANANVLHRIKSPWFPREKALRELFARAYVNGCTILIERDCFEKVGLFSEKWRYTQDTHMWLRLLQLFEFGYVPEVLVKQRSHGAQDSRNVRKHREEALCMYTEVFEELGLSGIFPHYALPADDPATIAMLHTWFGNSMVSSQRLFGFAYQEYWLALKAYPSWRNPAWPKIAINTLRLAYGLIRRR